MTDKLEGSKYVSLHFVWPAYLRLFGLLAESEEDMSNDLEGQYSITMKMKKLGREYMSKNAEDFAPTFEHKVMTVLNPTMKKLNKISFAERNALNEQIEQYLDDHYPSCGDSVDTQTFDSNILIMSSEKNSFLENFVSFDQCGSTEPQKSELTQYLKHPITCNVDILKWWGENAKTYPRLFQMFQKFSCIPGSSSSSERTFSTTGGIVTEKRSSILPKNVDNLIIARNALV